MRAAGPSRGRGFGEDPSREQPGSDDHATGSSADDKSANSQPHPNVRQSLQGRSVLVYLQDGRRVEASGEGTGNKESGLAVVEEATEGVSPGTSAAGGGSRAGGRRSGFEDGDSVAGGGRAGALSASRKSSSSAGALRAGSMETEHLPESGSRSRSNPRRIADSEPELPDSLQPTVLDDDSNSDDGGKSDGRLGPADGLGQHSRGVGQQRPHTSGSGSSAAAGSIGEVGAAREAEAAAAAAGAHARPRTAASDVSSLTRLSEESGTYM